MTKLIYVIIDGLADLPIKELKNKTPLEAAHTPNLDSLAKLGQTGLVYSVKKGIAPESDVAFLSLLGYDPFKYHVGRGVFEALGADMPFSNGDLALRCNFATLGESNRIIDRRAGRSLTYVEGEQLSKAINEKVKLTSTSSEFYFKHTTGHRGALVIKARDQPLSAEISNTDPAYSRQNRLGVAEKDAIMVLNKSWALNDSKEATMASMLLNEFTEKSKEVLAKHEINRKRESEHKPQANVILSRDAGDELPKLFNINEKYEGSFAAIVDLPVEISISRYAGMNIIKVPDWSGDTIKDCRIRVTKLLNAVSAYDYFIVHLKGPDVPGHDGDYELKREIISLIDEYFIGELIEKINLKDYVLCVTTDHSTPCEYKAHGSNPVPFLVSGNQIARDEVKEFSEKACEKGSFKIIQSGSELMPLIMSFIKK